MTGEMNTYEWPAMEMSASFDCIINLWNKSFVACPISMYRIFQMSRAVGVQFCTRRTPFWCKIFNVQGNFDGRFMHVHMHKLVSILPIEHAHNLASVCRKHRQFVNVLVYGGCHGAGNVWAGIANVGWAWQKWHVQKYLDIMRTTGS